MLEIDRYINFPLFNLSLSAASIIAPFAFPCADGATRFMTGLLLTGLHHSPIINTWPRYLASITACTFLAFLDSGTAMATQFLLRFACSCISVYLVDSIQAKPIDAFVEYAKNHLITIAGAKFDNIFKTQNDLALRMTSTQLESTLLLHPLISADITDQDLDKLPLDQNKKDLIKKDMKAKIEQQNSSAPSKSHYTKTIYQKCLSICDAINDMSR